MESEFTPPGYAARRIDVHMPDYAAVEAGDHSRIDRLAELIRLAVEEAIYAHAKAEIGPDTVMAALRQSVHSRIHHGLGPEWSESAGSEPIIPGTFSAPSWERDYSLERTSYYKSGARHIAVFVDWS